MLSNQMQLVLYCFTYNKEKERGVLNLLLFFFKKKEIKAKI